MAPIWYEVFLHLERLPLFMAVSICFIWSYKESIVDFANVFVGLYADSADSDFELYSSTVYNITVVYAFPCSIEAHVLYISRYAV